MRLSESERQSLALIERSIRADDPAFEGRMVWPECAVGVGPAARSGPAVPAARQSPVIVCVLVAVALLAVALLVLGAVALGAGAWVVGSVLGALDVAVACGYRRARRRHSDWIEGRW